ncbi:MAG: leucine-rich repeat domain-containing protein [Candidatus Marinimicrobia bacterium]|nr:leucine-rich repeat domain-containing protein [Candidatus Neomarinimicrobiota bacterium]
MALKNLFLICFPLIAIWGSDCPNGLLEYDDGCYYKQHFDVLQDFIDRNESLYGLDPLKLGYQEWTNNRLTHLYLGELQITIVPDSIGLLKDLNSLDLRKNKITALPEGICSIYPYYSQVNLSDNLICPPYPFCFEYLGNQDTRDCDAFECPAGFEEIQGECYNENHINVLQAIIDSNSVLYGTTPLELGKNVGYQQWENGKLTHLNLISNQLTTLPDNLCTIYNNLKLFNVSNNFICTPYPVCFEYIGQQNTKMCNNTEVGSNSIITDNISDNSGIIISQNGLEEINSEKFQKDIEVLQNFIIKNESLIGKYPLEIGKQEWRNMRLVSLDLSSLDLTYIPANICNIYSNLSTLNLSNNAICPPYPDCVEYVDFQNKEACGKYICPDNYTEIEGECYFAGHLKILQDIIDRNPSLKGKSPLDIGDAGGMQNWIGGKLNQLILVGNQLTDMPESICEIYSNLSAFEITNNYICPPYPSCIENVGYQNIDDCSHPLSCPDGFVIFDGECYYYDDLQVLIDFTKTNEVFTGYHPLLIGYQVWKNNRLQQLSLDGLGIAVVPESINKLNQLEYLNLNNNKLEVLPDNFCSIYQNLQSFQITNNLLCPPYLQCFDYIGEQNTENCEHSFCPYGYLDINEECYFEKDIATLNDFISQNESLTGRNPLEIGVQKWKNMRLHYLYLGVNQLTSIPESVCEIIPQLKTFNISENNICPPYPACIEKYIGEQDGVDCP